ncbi:MAG: zinc ribbon domain-containing protein [Clostridia bacterium]|nr:zinc ribbon domain-containing protein [Clostridia bacterium]
MTHEAYMKCPICQSCGMPMQHEEQFGKHADGSRNETYCIYCCPEGEERMQGTLEEMIAVYARIETQMGLHPDEETAEQRLSAYLPTLERWRK